jgi:hypothetical protein
MALSLITSNSPNVGQLQGDKSKGVLKKVFIFNGTIPTASYADTTTFFNKLVTNSKLSKTSADKIFTLEETQDLARNSESNAEGTLNLGFKTIIREGRPGYKWKFFGSADQLSRLRSFNSKTVRILEMDANSVVWGTKSGTNFIGYQAKLFFSGGEIATGQAAEEGVIECDVSILNNTEYKDNPYYCELPTDVNTEDIRSLIDVTMAEVSHTTNVWKISMKIPSTNLIENYNIYDDYGSVIAGLTFTAGTGVNYATALVITSVVVDATNKCLTVTFDSTAYTALSAGDKIKLIPPTPAVMDTANVTGIELVPVILTK